LGPSRVRHAGRLMAVFCPPLAARIGYESRRVVNRPDQPNHYPAHTHHKSRVAEADQRTVSRMVEMLIEEALRERGVLK
jgi:hypothetical protein